MARPPLPRTVLFYRLTTVVLLGIVAWLGIALQRTLDRARPHGSPPAAQPATTESRGLVVTSLTATLGQMSGVKADGSYWLFRSRFGGLRLVSLSPRQRVPLHLYRGSHEVIVPLSGEVETSHLAVNGRQTDRRTTRPAASTLLAYAPYTVHGWANVSPSQAAVSLVLSSRPEEVPVYVEAADDRVTLGSAPDVLDARRLLGRLQTSGGPSLRQALPSMGERIAAVAVSSETTIEPRPDGSALWVLAGRGKAFGPEEHVLEANNLALLPPQTTVRLQADAGAPLLLLDFQPGSLDLTSIVRTQQKLYSQYDEELLIRDFFRDRRGGTFLDVGCADYMRLSTTYYLEEKLGWSGLGVDALAEYAEGYVKHRPRTKFLNYLVSDTSSEPQAFYRAPGFAELSSTSRVVAEGQSAAAVEKREVPAITLNELLRQQGVASIDFLSMDIEDHEPQALAGFDIERYRPQLVCIEAHVAVADRIYRYFRSHRYTRIDRYLPLDPLNWYFQPEPAASSAGR